MIKHWYFVVVKERKGPIVFRRRVVSQEVGDELLAALARAGNWTDPYRFGGLVLITTDPRFGIAGGVEEFIDDMI